MRSDLPTGTVTLLFTDVEGSTRLLDELGADAYGSLLAEHHRVCRKAWVAHRGVEIDTAGDAFFVAFERPSDALAAAAAAQEGLARLGVRVRMGVHTGEVEVGETGYVGIEVHRAGRIAASGHGGQVVVSKQTRDLAGVDATDLGEHRVKDFPEPVWLFQLGSERFPPLKTISNTNLPRPVASFVGRERERDEITALLRNGSRLVTLSGPGGSGKTRLAIEAAAELVPSFPNGVFWVGLATLRDPSLVVASIAESLGAKDELASFLGERDLLLLLDNFEQVVEAAPGLAGLLEACPKLRLLVTSRELLRIRGEVTYPVPPLAEPEAVELFCLRSGLEPAPEVADLCGRLDNLPLAVELAAARTVALSPAQILERLAQRLDLLEGGRDADARQRTLRATIAWSYDLLEPPERRLFAGLAVFRGGCTLESAEQVLTADVTVLQSLVEKSLVQWTGERFWMLETIREFAGERLAELPEAQKLRGAQARLVLALTENAEQQLAGAVANAAVRSLDLERDNVRAALEWAYGNGEVTLGLTIATVLERYWWLRARAEGLDWLERGLSATADVPDELRCDALAAAGGSAYFSGDLERAIELFTESIELARRLGDEQRAARALARIAPPLYVAGRVEEGASYVAEAVEINRRIGYAFGLVESLHILAGAHRERGDLAGSRQRLEESLRIAREIDDQIWIAWDLMLLCDTAWLQGNLVEAWALGTEALGRLNERGDENMVQGLGTLAVLAVQLGHPRRGGLLWGAAERLDEQLGPSLFTVGRPKLEEQLGDRDAEFELGVADGRALELDQALERALISAP